MVDFQTLRQLRSRGADTFWGWTGWYGWEGTVMVGCNRARHCNGWVLKTTLPKENWWAEHKGKEKRRVC